MALGRPDTEADRAWRASSKCVTAAPKPPLRPPPKPLAIREGAYRIEHIEQSGAHQLEVDDAALCRVDLGVVDDSKVLARVPGGLNVNVV